jgi:hypothetical protein
MFAELIFWFSMKYDSTMAICEITKKTKFTLVVCCVWTNGAQKRSSIEVSVLVGYDATSMDNWFQTL